MNSPSFIINPIRFSIYLLIVSSLLLFQSPRPVQSISLRLLCGNFGHSCFGANWGKRSLSYETSPQYLPSNLDTDNDDTAVPSVVNENSMNNHVSEELRLKLFRQRLRQLLGFE